MFDRSLLVVFLTGVSIGCGGGADTPTTPGPTDIRVVAGEGVTDTVGTRPVQALVIEVRVKGQLEPGVVVRFENLPSTDTTRRFESTINVSKIAQNLFGAFASDTTNASGRASVLVQLGSVAGDARVVVSCPELGLADTAHFTVVPGSATKVVLSVRDTVVRGGGSYNIGAAASDRFGNRRPDPLSFDSTSPLATVDAAGKVQARQDVGRGFIRVSAGSAVDSAWFTVIPTVNLTYLHIARSGYTWIADLLNDGAVARERVQTPSPAFPVPSPVNDLIAYQHIDNYISTIYVVDGAGVARDLLANAGFLGAYYPQFSADGAFIYFSGRDSAGYGIWRIRLDGSDLKQIAPTGGGFTSPGVSPDGKSIAYSDPGMLVLDLSTGKKVEVGQTGWLPRFSQDGNRVAYLTGSSIIVANVDGTKSMQLAVPWVGSDAGLSWLRGGNWLITRGATWPMLVNANTSEYLTLRPLIGLYEIAAKP